MSDYCMQWGMQSHEASMISLPPRIHLEIKTGRTPGLQKRFCPSMGDGCAKGLFTSNRQVSGMLTPAARSAMSTRSYAAAASTHSPP